MSGNAAEICFSIRSRKTKIARSKSPRDEEAGFRLLASHVRNDVVAELGTLDFGCSLHQTSKIVCDPFAGNCSIDAPNNEVRRFCPAKVTQHHLTGKHHRARIDPIKICVFRSSAVRSLENRMSAMIINISTRSDPNPSHLGCQRVGQVVAVEVKGSNNVEIVWPRQNLL